MQMGFYFLKNSFHRRTGDIFDDDHRHFVALVSSNFYYKTTRGNFFFH